MLLPWLTALPATCYCPAACASLTRHHVSPRWVARRVGHLPVLEPDAAHVDAAGGAQQGGGGAAGGVEGGQGLLEQHALLGVYQAGLVDCAVGVQWQR